MVGYRWGLEPPAKCRMLSGPGTIHNRIIRWQTVHEGLSAGRKIVLPRERSPFTRDCSFMVFLPANLVSSDLDKDTIEMPHPEPARPARLIHTQLSANLVSAAFTSLDDASRFVPISRRDQVSSIRHSKNEQLFKPSFVLRRASYESISGDSSDCAGGPRE